MIKGLLTGDPRYPLPGSKVAAKPKYGQADNTADIRDSITNLVGSGYTAMNDDNARANYARLSNLVGQDKARKILDRIFLFNSRQQPNMNARDRVSQFYDSSVSNPDIEPIIKQAKTFGYGPLSGLNSSPDVVNMQLSGRLPSQPLAVSNAKAIINKFSGQ